MAGEVSERLGQLEQAIHRAVQQIARLKTEKSELDGRLTAQTRELEETQVELARLRQERREILTQVDGILKELDTLELG